jgi:hypothetical protein
MPIWYFNLLESLKYSFSIKKLKKIKSKAPTINSIRFVARWNCCYIFDFVIWLNFLFEGNKILIENFHFNLNIIMIIK